MPELQVGDDAPNFILPAIDGTSFDMTNFKGKRVILTFFRFSSCPFCNIRINRILKRWEEFDDDTVMVGVFDAKIDELKKSMKRHNPPFSVVADETYENFLKNDVKKSFLRFILSSIKLMFVPTSSTVPASKASGLSVVSLINKTGFPNDGASS